MSATLEQEQLREIFGYRCCACNGLLPEDQSEWGGTFVPFNAKDDGACNFWCRTCWQRTFAGSCSECGVPVLKGAPGISGTTILCGFHWFNGLPAGTRVPVPCEFCGDNPDPDCQACLGSGKQEMVKDEDPFGGDL